MKFDLPLRHKNTKKSHTKYYVGFSVFVIWWQVLPIWAQSYHQIIKLS